MLGKSTMMYVLHVALLGEVLVARAGRKWDSKDPYWEDGSDTNVVWDYR
jgi:hypothetical protein